MTLASLLAWSTAVACGGPGSAETDVVTLHSRVLGDTVELALPEGLVVAGSALVVQDAHPPPALRVIDTAGRVVASIGAHGSGPGEFAEPLDVFSRPGHADEFWVFDVKLGRMTGYRIDAAGGAIVPRQIGDPVALSEPTSIETPRWLDDTTVVALSPMLRAGEHRFALFARDGALRGTVGLPPPGDDRIRAFVRQQAYGGKIAVHPSRPLFVLASRYAGRLEVFDRAGRRVRSMDVPDAFEPDFTPARDGLNLLRGRGFRFGYLDVAATGDRIFGLFSGRTQEEEGPNYGRTVHVFGWNGDLVRVLRLDRPAFRITVDPARHKLFALQLDPLPQVLVYDLAHVPL